MVKLFHPAALAGGASAAGISLGAGLTLRRAGAADLPALAAVAVAAYAQGTAALLPAELRRRATVERFTALFAAALAQGGPLLLAEGAQGPLGCALAEKPEAGADARLSGLWVAPQVGGQGIGSTLLAAMEALLAAGGAPSLRVRVPSGHLRALGLFRRRGYAMQAAGQRTEPVLQVTLPHTVLAKALPQPELLPSGLLPSGLPQPELPELPPFGAAA
ncbi:GNAT family N-acetyltransferase [Roseomonas sp. GC11]|uniref:GNAT family N-acetyltransferase n=1 Tax=Roseomonas sp. GC11 TaxID=2950546 RepID=UPI00210B2116|nr:GNAT family N-acetyltransferase [Roseomonas sp. GC11]MCQ4158966.1 GNAT family N-acetyltransferase [Roseomonas sp. GC11]